MNRPIRPLGPIGGLAVPLRIRRPTHDVPPWHATPTRTAQATGERPARPGRRRVTLVLLGVVSVWAVAAAAQLARAYVDGRAGADELGRARQTISSTDWDDGVQHRLGDARLSFASARRRAAGLLVAPIRALPVVGRQIRAFADLSGAAEDVSAIGGMAVEEAGSALGTSPPAGSRRVAVLQQMAAVASRSEQRLASVELRRSAELVSPLARRWAELDGEVSRLRDRLRRSTTTAERMAEMLAGPRRYLLLAANNAEMRAGGGMFLSAGTLSTEGGALGLGPMRPTGDLVLGDGGVPLDRDLAALWSSLQPGREWRNLATTPRFDAVAPTAAQMWERLTGERVDGVLVVDVELVRALLAVTGPVTVGQRVLTDETVVEHLLYRQYLDLEPTEDGQLVRREQLGEIAGAALAALEGRPYEMKRLVAELARVAAGRHVLAWAADPEEQEGWAAAGITGALTADSLAVSLLNRGGNKLDRHLSVEGRLAVRPQAQGADVTVQVRMRNQAPDPSPAYVSGPHPDAGTREGDYLGILALNLPGSATAIAVEGDPPLVASGPDGPTTVVAVQVLLARGEERWATVRFRLPSPSGTVLVTPSARVPAMTWRSGPSVWRDDAPRLVSWRPAS